MRKKIVRKRTFIENFFKVTISLFFLGGLFFFIPVIGLLEYIIPVFFVLSFITIILNVIYRKKGICRLPMIISFIITVIFMCVSISTPIICFTFENTKLMYPIKKAIFAYGVRVHSEATMARFPEKLPINTEDYRFKTEGCFPAQDYSPHAYLYFRTDNETIAQLEKEKAVRLLNVKCHSRNFLNLINKKVLLIITAKALLILNGSIYRQKDSRPLHFNL